MRSSCWSWISNLIWSGRTLHMWLQLYFQREWVSALWLVFHFFLLNKIWLMKEHTLTWFKIMELVREREQEADRYVDGRIASENLQETVWLNPPSKPRIQQAGDSLQSTFEPKIWHEAHTEMWYLMFLPLNDDEGLNITKHPLNRLGLFTTKKKIATRTTHMDAHLFFPKGRTLWCFTRGLVTLLQYAAQT